MRSKIKERLQQIKKVRADVIKEPTKYVDKSSYIKMIDMYIEALRDIIYVVEAVNRKDKRSVSGWFARFRED